MDLGEMVCLPNGKPLCERCPLSSLCLSHRFNKEMDYPVKSKKAQKKEEEKTVLLFIYQDEVLIHKRNKEGLLASLYEFVTIDKKMSVEDVKSYCELNRMEEKRIEVLEERTFIFTHRIWRMSGYCITLRKKSAGMYVSIDSLSAYAIPSAFSYYRELLSNKKRTK